MNLRLKKTILFLAVIFSGFFWSQARLAEAPARQAQAAEVDQAITIDVDIQPIPGGGGGAPGGGLGGSDVPPVIFNVASSTSFTVATVSWSASDDLGVVTSSFVYGPTLAYGSSGAVADSYNVSLSGLATGTLYYFKISAVDTGAHTTEYSGTFSTTPPPPDILPPVISSVQMSVGVTTATITWDTNELADNQINYGLTDTYGSNYFDPALMLSHSALLFNLTPGTVYHFKIIATDGVGNSATTADATFTTQADNVPPPDASNFALSTTTNSIILSWVNPGLLGTPDFSGVRVVRKIGSASLNPGDGLTVYSGGGESLTDATALADINYFYTIFSFDTSGNNSPGIFRSGMIISGFVPPAPTPTSTITPPPATSLGPEICNNSMDDDGNGQTDCADSACAGFAGCAPASSYIPACSNGLDDDNDGLIDLAFDPGCGNADDNDEYTSPESTVPSFVKINLGNLSFLAGNRHINLAAVNEIVTGLSGANLTVAVPQKVLNSQPKTMVLRVGDMDQHQFVYNADDQMYYADLFFPGLGLTRAFVEIDYDSGQFDSIGFSLNSLPWGQIKDDDGNALAGVEISLYDVGGSLMPMGYYGQLNPMTSDVNGNYGWLTPNGDFTLELRQENYYSRSLSRSGVNNNVINQEVILIARPPKLELAIDPQKSVLENVGAIAKALVGRTGVLSNLAVQTIQDAAENPGVEKATERIVVPTAITVVTVGMLPLISWLDLLPLLRLLFLQPLMLLGLRRREKWGLVYNSLNKLPVDLAIVRLINTATGRIVQSKVTDAKGHFVFMASVGQYRVEVQRNGFIYPSKFLADQKSDGQRVDVYHGEAIKVENSASITANIPLDPVDAQKKPLRLVLEKFGRRLQVVLAWAGILTTGASLYISPKWYIWLLLFVHIAFYFIFRKLAIPAKPKNWGIVYDEANKKPVSRVVARLFNLRFNKLVATQITDNRGRYSFLAGDDNYYVTYEHREYHPFKTEPFDLAGKESQAIIPDIKLKRH